MTQPYAHCKASLPRRPFLHVSGQMFQRKNVLHAQISLHETVQILLQIAMLFAVQKLPGLVKCKRGIINIETEIWA